MALSVEKFQERARASVFPLLEPTLSHGHQPVSPQGRQTWHVTLMRRYKLLQECTKSQMSIKPVQYQLIEECLEFEAISKCQRPMTRSHHIKRPSTKSITKHSQTLYRLRV